MEGRMTKGVGGISGGSWQDRLTSILDTLPEGAEIELDHLVVRVEPTSVGALTDEVIDRASKGRLTAVYRISSPRTSLPLCDLPFDAILPREIEDDWTGETVKLDFHRDIELVVSAGPR
jgi:hypothetical protein